MLERIGAGSMGEVFRGRSVGSGQDVAIKILLPAFADDAETRARFVQEQVLVRLVGPNLVQVVDFVAEGATLAIVMDLVNGPDLRGDHDAGRGPMEPREGGARIVAGVMTGLAVVHEAGIVHRDVKPENVLMDTAQGGAPTPKLTDFGVARLAYGSSLTRRNTLIGTPEYMAPELAKVEPSSGASDVYGAGIVLYERLAGRTPFAGGHPVAVLNRHIQEEPTRPEAMPSYLWAINETLLAKKPSDRPTAVVDAGPSTVAVLARTSIDRGGEDRDAGARRILRGRRNPVDRPPSPVHPGEGPVQAATGGGGPRGAARSRNGRCSAVGRR